MTLFISIIVFIIINNINNVGDDDNDGEDTIAITMMITVPILMALK